MRKAKIEADLKELAFDFFCWFYRFEFALKENILLKRGGIGDNAEPGWESFIERHRLIHENCKTTISWGWGEKGKSVDCANKS